MNTYENIVKWAETLGYQDTVPDSLKSICNNPTTSVIWHQLLTEVKPKQEVQKIRYNNLKVRLESNNEHTIHMTNSAHPMREIELYKKKRKLQCEIEEIKAYINEKEVSIKRYSNEHKIIAMRRRRYKELIKENESKLFLLRKKTEAFRREITEMEENVTFFRNLTPTESAEEESDVKDRLRKCVVKIESSLSNERLAPACPTNNLFSTPQKSSSMSIFAISDGSFGDYLQCDGFRQEIAGNVRCLDDANLCKEIKSVLYNTDSRKIFDVIIKDVDVSKAKLLNLVMNRSNYDIPKKNYGRKSMADIVAKQIENELHFLINTKEIRKLRREIRNKENDLEAIIEQSNLPSAQIQDLRELISLQQKQAGLIALNDCIGKQISEFSSIKDAKKELEDTNQTIAKLQQKMVDDLRELNHLFELYKKMYKTMSSYREETRLLVRKLNQFSSDLSWTLPLTHNLHSKEIAEFKDFPLEYNRKLTTTDAPLYVRDIMKDISIDVDKIDSETLHMLLLLIDSPYSTPEALFQNLWEKKIKLQMQKSLETTIKAFDFKTFTMEELEKQESYVDCSIEKLDKFRRREPIQSSNQDVNAMRELAKLWLELPFADYVLPSRLHEGKNLLYYQNMYNALYELIKKS